MRGRYFRYPREGGGQIGPEAAWGTVTVMFTDLVGSASLADRLGDTEAQALRRAHERGLRRRVLFEVIVLAANCPFSSS